MEHRLTGTSQVEPYIDDYNLPVFSQNGETPVFYDGFHQTDVIRIKASVLSSHLMSIFITRKLTWMPQQVWIAWTT